MLAKRIIPCLDIREGRVVKGTNFLQLRDAGEPVALAKYYDTQGADELVFLDISATHLGRETVISLARDVANQVFIPFTVGGGIKTVAQMRAILRAGADKVAVNSAAVANPALIQQAAEQFGCQALVVAIDARRHRDDWEVVVHGGRKSTGKDAVVWAQQVSELGAGEILLTSMDRDGTKSGFDIELTQSVAAAVDIPVIASGGAGSCEDFAAVLTDGRANAALAASLFHYHLLTIPGLKSYLARQQIPVRGIDG